MRLLLLLLLFSSLHAESGFVEPWGKDGDLKVQIAPPTAPSSLMIGVAKALIHFHQNIISPVDGPRSHFKPSSSNYMLLAMQKHGFTQGFIMGCDRLLRENDASWVYQTIVEDGKIYKYDFPP